MTLFSPESFILISRTKNTTNLFLKKINKVQERNKKE